MFVVIFFRLFSIYLAQVKSYAPLWTVIYARKKPTYLCAIAVLNGIIQIYHPAESTAVKMEYPIVALRNKL